MTSVFLILIFFLFAKKCAADYDVDCSNETAVNEFIAELRKYQSTLFSLYANTTQGENLSTINQEHDEMKDYSLGIDDILPKDKISYLKRRPPTICGHPAYAIYHVTVMSLDSINEASMVKMKINLNYSYYPAGNS